MKKLLFFITTLVMMAGSASAQLDLNKLKSSLEGKLTADEVGAGLKEALSTGVSKGADLVSVSNGYFGNPQIKIPFPAEIKQVETRLRKMGMGNQVDQFVLSLNQAAEEAAKEAKPVFISAIKQMTIQDVWAVFKGKEDAATQYLNRTTSAQLHEKFKPVVKQSLEKVNATKYYATLISAYNKLPLVKKVNTNLEDYATNKAIEGLFVMVAKEEKNIRQNPTARTSDLLKKVFGS